MIEHKRLPHIFHSKPGLVALSDARPLGVQMVRGLAKHSFAEIGYEVISTTILSLLQVQVGPLSVTVRRRICPKYWLST